MAALAAHDQFDAVFGRRRGTPSVLSHDDSELLWSPDEASSPSVDLDGVVIVVTLAHRNDRELAPSKQLLMRTADGVSTVELADIAASNPPEVLGTFDSAEAAMAHGQQAQFDLTVNGGRYLVVPTP